MQIKPLGDHIVVKAKKEAEITASGIVLPDTIDKEKKAEGEVVAIGPGKLLENGNRAQIEVVVGQTVLYKKWGGDDVKVDGEEYKIVNQEDILAILE
ncbi:MAG: co-chaperone GroES [Candidatus Magasanikbacteria bacterium RIFCSPHIGHO2_01_FULL_33_34]|uniref:Co-chaperonin GroES n=1 Tax=Candidatus Magasanikbacteria bacterium RIFCSPHIGHO2_01_FULL_33_34 TaxID=1798671 RepID=A0A1F6LKF2_9BACT|nr:MAG: co-chaperone GroES [Candidatus Magasanikbacteria bacterium RIFCSPHIGHO2_01_FULL_33_34]OGH65567.1 MAG: co-chaperone GroES [Candidatus Magasanikbacteria bacterium RIFCSPHIGHO2_02_FULL_33_17]OGH76277.1 MAG: co-chaperone GroES [Candidatus Magasanikbacteria bacterium RIFCSPLOWO2_01_FULL_33_34]OGH81426.1 MAG: co-chaperone GroES [Candidatus Magasanikbacteria bacterium RIFCSPLOWO2_12_FULL_34_7]